MSLLQTFPGGKGGAGGGAAEEMTYSEYNALTEEQKNDGTVRYVPDYPSEGGSGGSDMSPEDLEEVKNNFTLIERDIPEAMSAADLNDVKAAFVLD